MWSYVCWSLQDFLHACTQTHKAGDVWFYFFLSPERKDLFAGWYSKGTLAQLLTLFIRMWFISLSFLMLWNVFWCISMWILSFVYTVPSPIPNLIYHFISQTQDSRFLSIPESSQSSAFLLTSGIPTRRLFQISFLCVAPQLILCVFLLSLGFILGSVCS